MTSAIERVEQAIQDLQQGKMIILMDHPDRENEGDLIFPAETITVETMNFIIRHSSGIVCLSLVDAQLKQLELPLIVPQQADNTSLRAPFTMSIDARVGATTGVSAADRVRTIQAAINPDAKPDDLLRPGHMFPLGAKAGGVLERAGHTEGSVDLVRLAGFKPAAVLCEVMNSDGTMTRGQQLSDFSKEHDIRLVSISDLVAYRLATENLIKEETSVDLPLESYGTFKMTVIKESITGQEHVILEKKSDPSKPPLVRMHSACLTGDIFLSQRCDCHHQLHYALEQMSREGGILIYLNQEGRGIGLFNKIKAYALQQSHGLDTIEANEALGLPVDARQYYIAAHFLKAKGINHIRLLTNNPAKITGLTECGIQYIDIMSIPRFSNAHNKKYLDVKISKLKHLGA